MRRSRSTPQWPAWALPTCTNSTPCELAAGTLVRLLQHWSPGLGRPFLYYPRQRYVSSALRTFIDLAKARGGGLEAA